MALLLLGSAVTHPEQQSVSDLLLKPVDAVVPPRLGGDTQLVSAAFE